MNSEERTRCRWPALSWSRGAALAALALLTAVPLSNATSVSPDSQESADNPIRVVAQKALKGEFGNLASWQYKAYEYALIQDANVKGQAWVTVYGPWEGFPRGDNCAYGYNCSESTAAANAIPAHYYVLIELPQGWEMRRIEDRGASWNDRFAHRRGADVWIDRWVPDEQGTVICRYAAIRAYRTW